MRDPKFGKKSQVPIQGIEIVDRDELSSRNSRQTAGILARVLAFFTEFSIHQRF
jgi:hypothetical protein